MVFKGREGVAYDQLPTISAPPVGATRIRPADLPGRNAPSACPFTGTEIFRSPHLQARSFSEKMGISPRKAPFAEKTKHLTPERLIF